MAVEPTHARGLTPLKDLAATIAASRHRYVARAIAPNSWVAAWRGEGEFVAILGSRQGRARRYPWLLIMGAADAIARDLPNAIATAEAFAGEKILRITLPRAVGSLLDTPKSSSWDWMEIAHVPPRALHEDDVEPLAIGRDDQEITRFLNRVSPTASTLPGDPELIAWRGIRHGSALVSVGGAVKWQSGVAVLVSIATEPELRGQGLGHAVTASLTRSLMESGESVVALGMYAANDSARKTYERVGFSVIGEFTSCGFG